MTHGIRIQPLVLNPVAPHVVKHSEEQHHVFNGPCWCRPRVICAECEGEIEEPCIHGTARRVVIIHRDAS